MVKGQRLKPEQIVTLLRQIDVLTTDGKTLAQPPEKLWQEKPLILVCFVCLVLMIFLMNYSLPSFTSFFQQSVLR